MSGVDRLRTCYELQVFISGNPLPGKIRRASYRLSLASKSIGFKPNHSQ